MARKKLILASAILAVLLSMAPPLRAVGDGTLEPPTQVICFDKVKTVTFTATATDHVMTQGELMLDSKSPDDCTDFEVGDVVGEVAEQGVTVVEFIFKNPGVVTVRQAFNVDATAKSLGESPPPDATAEAKAVQVEITKYYKKMLVEGEFNLTAEGIPADEDTYSWSFTGAGGGNFDPNPSDDGKTKFKTNKITSTVSESLIKVKYSVDDDEKEVKITRLDGVALRDKNDITQTQPSDHPFVRKSNTNHVLFAYTYVYLLFDQYRKRITESEYGGAKPMIKESFGKLFTPYPKLRSFMIPFLTLHSSKPWSPQETDWFHDRVLFGGIKEDFFRMKNEEFFHTVRDGRLVFDLLNHVWHGSVNKTNVVDMTNNKMHSEFIDVRKGRVGFPGFRHEEVISFQTKTTYTVQTKYKIK